MATKERTRRHRSRSRSRSPRRREEYHRGGHERSYSSRDYDRQPVAKGEWRHHTHRHERRNYERERRSHGYGRRSDEYERRSHGYEGRTHDYERRQERRKHRSPSSTNRVDTRPENTQDSQHLSTRRCEDADDRDRRKQAKGNEENAGRWGREDEAESDSHEKKEDTAHLEARDFSHSGKLLEDTNTYKGVVVKYSEPDEARIPKRRWRLYPFKGDQQLDVLYIHRQSAYLIGRDRKVCDIPMHHPSISKQHAALQYRLVPYEHEDGTTHHRVRPYIIDLGSTNGTYINNQRVESSRYYELKEQDMIKFGFSSREYVLLHESSKDETANDDDAQADM